MIRWALFAVLAVGLAGYAHWVYTRRELVVPEARHLALVRTAVLLLLLALLFDVRVPAGDAAGVAPDWVLLDASLSMAAGGDAGATPFQEALSRARALESDGYRVVRFGEDPPPHGGRGGGARRARLPAGPGAPARRGARSA